MEMENIVSKSPCVSADSERLEWKFPIIDTQNKENANEALEPSEQNDEGVNDEKEEETEVIPEQKDSFSEQADTLADTENAAVVCNDPEIIQIHETTPQDLKNFCATQACGQPEDLVRLSEAALTTLKSLWNEIGYTDYECDNAKAEMFAEVKRVFETKLSSTQEVKCNLVSQVRLVGARVCTIELEVGEPSKIDELKANETLRASLAAHKEYLEVLEAKKAERAAILSARVCSGLREGMLRLVQAEELTALYYDLDDALTTEQTKFLKVTRFPPPALARSVADAVDRAVRVEDPGDEAGEGKIDSSCPLLMMTMWWCSKIDARGERF
eukprot:476323-Hanusia_phi.AAC.2